MKWETATQRKKVHATQNQLTLTEKNNLITPRLQNYRKEHMQNGSLIKKHYDDTYQTITKILQNRKN